MSFILKRVSEDWKINTNINKDFFGFLSSFWKKNEIKVVKEATLTIFGKPRSA